MNRKSHPQVLYDVIIVGGGPAGLTASIYTSRARLKTLLVQSEFLPSQVAITEKIENYPGFPDGINGFELIARFKKQSTIFGTEFIFGEVENIRVEEKGQQNMWQLSIKDGLKGEIKKYDCLSVIIASGARPRKVGITGEDKLIGKGVSYCAICDGAFFRDKDVIVVGGGDTAVKEALFLTGFAKKVTLIHRRDRLRATKILQERISANKKIELVFNSQVIEIVGEDKVRAVKLKNTKTEKEAIISCDGVFVFVGLSPNTDFLKGLVALDEKGYIIAGVDMGTQAKGIFVCGDCRKKLLFQVVTACGDGATAAFSARQYVEDLKGIAYK